MIQESGRKAGKGKLIITLINIRENPAYSKGADNCPLV